MAVGPDLEQALQCFIIQVGGGGKKSFAKLARSWLLRATAVNLTASSIGTKKKKLSKMKTKRGDTRRLLSLLDLVFYGGMKRTKMKVIMQTVFNNPQEG